MQYVPAFEPLLADGILQFTDAPAGHVPGGATGADGEGVKLADNSTWDVWSNCTHGMLWQAVALQCHLDPDCGQMPDIGGAGAKTAAGFFHAYLGITCGEVEEGRLPRLSHCVDTRFVVVDLREFADWTEGFGLIPPARFPRYLAATAPATKRRAPQASQGLTPEGFVREAQLIPAIVPFSKATLWRMVSSGEFPKPIKLSKGITAWRYADIVLWLDSRARAEHR